MKSKTEYSAVKSISGVILIITCLSCNEHSDKVNENASFIRKTDKLLVEANLVASYSNFTNPKDRNYYYLVDVKLINNSNKDCEFYSLICGSLINIVTDSRQVSFLYHNCSADLASIVKLHPKQEYSVSAILVRYKYQTAFNPSIRFGFIISKPKAGPLTNNEIVSDLKSMREKQENVIWSEPIILTATNSYTYQIRDIVQDSATAETLH